MCWLTLSLHSSLLSRSFSSALARSQASFWERCLSSISCSTWCMQSHKKIQCGAEISVLRNALNFKQIMDDLRNVAMQTRKNCKQTRQSGFIFTVYLTVSKLRLVMDLLLLLSVGLMSFFLSVQSSSSFRQLWFLSGKQVENVHGSLIHQSMHPVCLIRLMVHLWDSVACYLYWQLYYRHETNMYRFSLWYSWSSRVKAAWIIVMAWSRTALKSLWTNICIKRQT